MRLLSLLALALAVSACAGDPTPADPPPPTVDPADVAPADIAPADVFGLADPYVRAAPAGGVSAMFVQIENATGSADTLVTVRTDAAGRVEIHRTQENAEGLSEMVPVEGGLPVPAGETVSLEPGGLHVMLLDLQRDLAAGDTLDVELDFAGRDPLTVRAPIRGL